MSVGGCRWELQKRECGLFCGGCGAAIGNSDMEGSSWATVCDLVAVGGVEVLGAASVSDGGGLRASTSGREVGLVGRALGQLIGSWWWLLGRFTKRLGEWFAGGTYSWGVTITSVIIIGGYGF